MYWFTGFFTKPVIHPSATLAGKAVWREIVAPFTGIGIRVPQMAGVRPGPEEARLLLADAGLRDAADWLFMDYVTWGGRIDSVYGFGASGDHLFGPVDESDGDKVQAAYLELMGEFGVIKSDALHFPPFVRGFWGE